MIVGLVSDSHDNAPLARSAAAFFHAEAPDAVFHLGDITRPDTLALFDGLPIRFLRGNNDTDARLDPTARARGHEGVADAWRGSLAGLRVGATHGHRKGTLRELQADCDVVLSGHTHKRRAERENGVLMVNPGALHRARHKTIALLRLPDKRVEFFRVTESGVDPFS